MSTDIAVWIAAALALAYYSNIYKENPVFRFVEHLFVGISTANGIVQTFEQYIKASVVQYIGERGEYHYIVPIVIGLLIYTRFLPNRDYNWLARIPLAFWIGIGSAIVIVRTFRASFMVNLAATFVPLVGNNLPFTAWTGPSVINNIVLFVGVFAVISYFFFTFEQKGALAVSAKLGRYVMMIAFGAAYGNTIMARSAVLLGRLQFLLGNWLGIIATRV
ncbi:MAG: hypothetical protein FWE76_06600 [Symbiobacteriaceae bacterium]|nr:hypothetical protein [Symbiobacteriaceae bacterium]